MTSSLLPQLEQALDLSHQMLTAFNQEDWDEIKTCMEQRRVLLNNCQMMAFEATEAESHQVRQIIEQIERLDEQLMPLALSVKQQTLDAIKQNSTGKKMLNAYSKHRS